MGKATFFRVIRLAAQFFLNMATVYFGASIFTPLITSDPKVVIINTATGIFYLFGSYLAQKIIDENEQ
jgi:hypothetical protein